MTNCNRRIFFSLSISLTNWSKNTIYNYIKISSTLSIFFYLSFVDVRLRDAKKHKIEWNFAVEKSPTRIESIIKISTCISLLILTQDSPSRTTWPVWSSSGNACKSCSSPSHPHPFLAYHTTSTVEKKNYSCKLHLWFQLRSTCLTFKSYIKYLCHTVFLQPAPKISSTSETNRQPMV